MHFTLTISITRRTLSILFAVMAAILALSFTLAPRLSQAQSAPAPFEDKVVYHIDEPAMMAHALGNITNHLAVSPQAKITLLANGEAVRAMVQGDYSERIAQLQTKGVRFVSCNNSMRHFKIDPLTLTPGVVVVPAGVAELSRLQVAEHYAYIKP